MNIVVNFPNQLFQSLWRTDERKKGEEKRRRNKNKYRPLSKLNNKQNKTQIAKKKNTRSPKGKRWRRKRRKKKSTLQCFLNLGGNLFRITPP